MDEIKRLTPAQRARCNRLIRRLCANYDGGAASNIKRRESLDFRGFFEGEAGAGQLFDLGIPKILGEPRPAPDALSRFATPLCQVHDKKIFIFSCPHVPAFLIGILPPPVSVRRQKTHEVAPFLPAAYTQKLCRLFCNKTQSA